MSGTSTSASQSQSSAAQSTKAYDIANNIAPQDEVGGSVINLNLTDLKIKGSGNKTKSAGGTSVVGKGGKASSDSSGSNSGVQFNMLDNGVISKAFNFVNDVVKGAFASNQQSITGVLAANERAQMKPSDSQNNYLIWGMVAVAIVFFIWGRK